jgi:SpoVK/Ycf46/Vps4 family AAA+-type ATPase
VLYKELLIKNASDLLDMYVGNTEKYIRETFEVAEEEDKILVLDEADSFFQKRNSAAHQWQVSQVNEILSAMEGFRGVLICTTNFIDHFDSASLRRFAYKVKFDYLKIHQKVSIFNQLFEEMIQLPQKQTVANRLKSVSGLTIGDFTTVYKQAIFLPEITFSTIVGLLEKESSMKKGPHKKIGF